MREVHHCRHMFVYVVLFSFYCYGSRGKNHKRPSTCQLQFLMQLPPAQTEWQETAQRRWTTSGSGSHPPSPISLCLSFSQSPSIHVSHPRHQTIRPLRFLLTADDMAVGRQESRIILGNIAPSFGSSVSRVTRLFFCVCVCVLARQLPKRKEKQPHVEKMKQSY